MRPIVLCALMTGALAIPAYADQLPITPEAYAAREPAAYPASQPVDVPSQPAAAEPVGANAGAPRYAEAGQPNLGGGFIEFLFGGAARQSAVPRAYQPAPADYQPQPLAAPNEPVQRYSVAVPGEPAHAPVDAKYDRQLVDYAGNEPPGTIIIDTPNKFLFLVEQGGKAMRYGIGVGRPGFTWAGVKTISAMREWPDWRPPDDMLKRRPDLPRYMAGGAENPLGARALYLGSTLYRIHGSNEPWTIGTQVSSGCIRMRNEDVIDLYDRVKVGTKVVVI
jgi:lipoprotein-anchoring transpeptidase ErfK/SrfK